MINFEKILLLLCIFLFGYADVQGKATGYTGGSASITYKPKFSTAVFFELPNSGREVFSMNPAWRFYKGDVAEAETADFDDSSWTVVSLPNGIEYLPTEASGCVNYQGEVWYRKHFTPADTLKGKSFSFILKLLWGKAGYLSTGN